VGMASFSDLHSVPADKEHSQGSIDITNTEIKCISEDNGDGGQTLVVSELSMIHIPGMLPVSLRCHTAHTSISQVSLDPERLRRRTLDEITS
jgi:hypothetical protein